MTVLKTALDIGSVILLDANLPAREAAAGISKNAFKNPKLREEQRLGRPAQQPHTSNARCSSSSYFVLFISCQRLRCSRCRAAHKHALTTAPR